MSIADYSAPVDQLLTQGECSWRGAESWLNYSTLGLTAQDIPSLIAMATDNDLYEMDSEAPEGWAPVHAWRALGQLRAETAVAPLLQQSLEYADDEGWRDWTLSELPRVFELIGAPAIPALTELLNDRTKSGWQRIITTDSLEAIAKSHPESASQCISILQEELSHFNQNDPELNAGIIGVLVEFRVMDAVPLMEQAFAARKVDELFIGDWDEVQVTLGLKSPDEVPPKRSALRQSLLESDLFVSSSDFDTTNYQRQKAKKKAKRKQQSEARRKNRKKK